MTTLEKRLRDQYNECLALRIYISWLDFLRTVYDSASEKKQYNKCADIQNLICDEINGTF